MILAVICIIFAISFKINLNNLKKYRIEIYKTLENRHYLYTFKKSNLDTKRFASIEKINQQIKLAKKNGKSQEESIQILLELLEKYLHIDFKSLQIFREYCIKISCLLSISYMGRILIFDLNHINLNQIEFKQDLILQLFSVLSVLFGIFIGLKLRTKNWFLNTELTPEALLWFQNSLNLRINSESPWENEMKKIEELERTSGTNLNSEKTILLRSFEQKKYLEHQMQINLYRKTLSIFEFFCGVIPALIILIIPILNLL